MIPGSKGLKPRELAHKWLKDLGTRPNMSIRVECEFHDMRMLGRIVEVRSTEQSVGIIIAGVCSNIINDIKYEHTVECEFHDMRKQIV